MTILSGQSIRRRRLVSPCHERTRHDATGLTFGLGPAGYDLTIKAGLILLPHHDHWAGCRSFALAVANEEFNMHSDVLGRVCDKSSLARQGIQVFNTVIEPGWRGFLTLEIFNNGPEEVRLVAGQPIAQVVFELLDEPAERPYEGRYQDQPHEPVPYRPLAEGEKL